MFKRVLIALVLFGIGIYILGSPDGVCFDIFTRDLCSFDEKAVLFRWILFFDSLLLLYVLLPFFHLGAMRFLIKAKNTNKSFKQDK